MKNIKYILFAWVSCVLWDLQAQVVDGSFGYYRDALLFGQTDFTYGSTARIQGIGGVQTSLGADMSSTGSNPAGLGFFNRSVVSFTPSMDFHNNDATFQGGTLSTYRNNFNFSNLGIVFNSNKGNYTDEKFKGGSFAISLNRTNNFNQEMTYQGRNNDNSIIDSYIQSAGTLDPDNLGGFTYAGYENYLINPVYDDNGELLGYDSFVLGFPLQNETVTTSGGQYQVNFAWGGNYNDKIYFGGGIGLATVDYRIRRNYTESQFVYEDENGDQVVDEWINSINVRDELDINGSGVNATLGVIVRPVNYVTLGISYQTPTYYGLDEESGFSQDVSWNNVQVEDGGDTIVLNDESFISDILIGQYNLRTPAKINGGATIFLGKAGFISADIEYVDFATSQLKSGDFTTVADNQSINNLYTDVINYRVGAEFRVENFRFRTGFAHFGDPYQERSQIDNTRRNISFGVGYRTRDYFVDLAIVNRKSQDIYSPYSVSADQPIVESDQRSTTAAVTVGFNF